MTAVDRVGNKAHIQRHFMVDAMPPTIEFEMGEHTIWKDVAQVAKGANLWLNVFDDGSGVAEVSYCMGEAECHPYKGVIVLDELGEHDLTVFARDFLGNIATSRLKIVVNDHEHSLVVATPEKGRRQWASDPVYGAIGPNQVPFFLQIADGPGKDANIFTLDIPDGGLTNLINDDGIIQLKVAVGRYIREATIPLDVTPPTVALHLEGATRHETDERIFYGTNLSARFTAEDQPIGNVSGVAAIYYKINGQGYRVAEGDDLKLNQEQNYLISYYSVDRVGNRSAIEQKTFTVDSTPPTSRVRPLEPYFRNSITRHGGLAIEAVDYQSGVAQILFGFNESDLTDYSLEAMQKALAELPAGQNRLSYYAVDLVGNREAIKYYEFDLDDAPPVVSATFFGPHKSKDDMIILGSDSRVQLAATDLGSGVEQIYVRFDNEEPQKYSSLLSFPKQAGAVEQYFSFWAVDRVGLRSEAVKMRAVIDDKPPISRLSSDGPFVEFGQSLFLSYPGQIVISAEDDLSGVSEILYRINTGPLLIYDSPIAVGRNEELDLTFYAIDKIGNRETPRQVRVISDDSSPTVAIEVGATQINDGTTASIARGSLLRIAAVDQRSGIKQVLYRLNGNKELQVYRQPVLLAGPGPYDVDVLVRDWVDNEKSLNVKLVVE